MCDNSSSVSISKELVFHSCSKHIKIKFHFIRELQQSKEVLLDHYTFEDQLTNIFNKSPSKKRFEAKDWYLSPKCQGEMLEK